MLAACCLLPQGPQAAGSRQTALVQKQVRKGTCGEEVHINERRGKYALNKLFLFNKVGDSESPYTKAIVVEYHYWYSTTIDFL